MSDPAFDPEDIPYFFDNWCSLAWTEWIPFNADRETFGRIPKEPGVYRIRPAGRDFLMYIGETRQPLHKKLAELRQSLRRADLMPWSDPHDVAPCLWAHWVFWAEAAQEEKPAEKSAAPGGAGTGDGEREGTQSGGGVPEGSGKNLPGESPGDAPADDAAPVMLEVSAAPLDASDSGRKGMEAYLLYRYRQERGGSTLCNFGRFHPRYRKSTNRNEGKRGGKLEEGQKDNPAGFPDLGPLEAAGKPGEPDWMGLEWPAFVPLVPEKIGETGPGAGLYLLADAMTGEILYIGQSADIAKRLLDHSRKEGAGRALSFSFQAIGQSVLPHNLRELETDLIGNFFEQYRRVPEFQFRSRAARTGGE